MNDIDPRDEPVLDMLREEADRWDEDGRPPCFAVDPSRGDAGRCRDDVDGHGCHHPKVTREPSAYSDLAAVLVAWLVLVVLVALAVSLVNLAVTP
jgi:hypothetical protein